ncbi:MAG TPA: hypothetical protein DCS05_05920 [Nitrospiraceae bacterium]|nr:hypothetical protein [Nitrospiraceae bacterium]
MPAEDRGEFASLSYKFFCAVGRGEFSIEELMNYFRLEQDNKFVADGNGNVIVYLLEPTNPNLAKYGDDILHLVSLYKCVREGRDVGLKRQLGESLYKDVDRGARVIGGSKAGHEAIHGTQAQKEARWAKQQAEVDRIYGAHPKWSWAEIKRHVAKTFGISTRTIHRHVPNPKKRKS